MNKSSDEILTLGTFLLNGLEFGVDILKQHEVLRMMPVVKLPHAARFIEGLINLRGAAIPIVNMRTRFGMPHKVFDDATRILNVQVSDTLIVGCIVDAVGHVRTVDKSLIEPVPPVIIPAGAEYISGIGRCERNLLIVLNIEKMFSTADFEPFGF